MLSFWNEAIEAPTSWGFWDWVAYSASVLAILTFIAVLLRLVIGVVFRRLILLISWGTKQNLILAHKGLTDLLNDLKTYLNWQQQPHLMIAVIAHYSAKIALFMGAGFLLVLISPSPFGVLLGIPIIGIALLGCWLLADKMALVIKADTYVEKKTKLIEKKLGYVERMAVMTPELSSHFNSARDILSQMKDISAVMSTLARKDTIGESTPVEAEKGESSPEGDVVQ